MEKVKKNPQIYEVQFFLPYRTDIVKIHPAQIVMLTFSCSCSVNTELLFFSKCLAQQSKEIRIIMLYEHF